VGEFDSKKYTEDALIKQAALIELHSKDGSAVTAGCDCIEGKHLHIVEGLAEEGMGFAVSEREKKFYEILAPFSQSIRKAIEKGDFIFPEVDPKTLEEQRKLPLTEKKSNPDNPAPRGYAPYGWTECEKAHPDVQRKIRRCARKIEKRQTCPMEDWGSGKECVNPYAVCRASIRCPS